MTGRRLDEFDGLGADGLGADGLGADGGLGVAWLGSYERPLMPSDDGGSDGRRWLSQVWRRRGHRQMRGKV